MRLGRRRRARYERERRSPSMRQRQGDASRLPCACRLALPSAATCPDSPQCGKRLPRACQPCREARLRRHRGAPCPRPAQGAAAPSTRLARTAGLRRRLALQGRQGDRQSRRVPPKRSGRSLQGARAACPVGDRGRKPLTQGGRRWRGTRARRPTRRSASRAPDLARRARQPMPVSSDRRCVAASGGSRFGPCPRCRPCRATLSAGDGICRPCCVCARGAAARRRKRRSVWPARDCCGDSIRSAQRTGRAAGIA